MFAPALWSTVAAGLSASGKVVVGARFQDDPRGQLFGEKLCPSPPAVCTMKLTPAPLNDSVKVGVLAPGGKGVRVWRLNRPDASVVVVAVSSEVETVTPAIGSE